MVRKSSVHDANAAYVQQLRVPNDATDDQIQAALTRLFNQNSVSDQQSILKLSIQDSVQDQETLLNQFKPEHSVQDQDQNQMNSRQSKSKIDICKLSVLRSGVLIDADFKNKIYSLLKEESPYDVIMAELEGGMTEVKRKNEVFKIRKGMLMMHQENQNEELDYWRTIIPDDHSVRNSIVTELHVIPYSLYPGIQRTVQKVRKHFFWRGMTGNVREFVESCPVCQTEKTDHTLGRGVLQSTSIPEKKWSEVSLDFITDLPVTKGKKDSILTVVDKATRMVHLIPCRKTTTADEAAKMYWDNIVRLHGVPTVLYSDRGTQFTSQFWKTLWGLTGTQLRYSTAYHPQTQGVVERMNAVVGQMLRCIDGLALGHWDACGRQRSCHCIIVYWVWSCPWASGL